MKTKTIYLGDLDLADIPMGWPIPPHVNRTVRGTLLCVGGREFARGVWMNANCRIPVALNGRGVRFRAMCGPDDLVPQSQSSCMEFLVETDGRLRFRSGRMVQGDAAVAVDVDLAGAETLTLILDCVDGKDGNAQGDWLDAVIEFEGDPPPHVIYPADRHEPDFDCPAKGYDAFHPAKSWYDTDGVKIQAHGGGLLKVGERYYWYGEHKGGSTTWWPKARVDIIGVGVYSSTDLYNWRNEGIVLPAEPDKPDSPLHPSNVLERPKVLFNAKTGKYVLWVKSENASYQWGRVIVATAEDPAGPFEIVDSFQPAGQRFGDFALYEEDGTGYLIVSSGGVETTFIHRLTQDYLNVEEQVAATYAGQKREAPAILKKSGRYYLITSGKSGWSPNPTRYATAPSLAGPWEDRGEVFMGEGSQYSFRSQPTYVFEHDGTVIYMGDRWHQRDLGDSRYVWLPLDVIDGKMTGCWLDEWRY